MAKKRIGELLLERKAITLQQLEEGLAFHRQTGQRLGVALIQAYIFMLLTMIYVSQAVAHDH